MPTNYANGKVYVVRNEDNDKVYVGSTTQTLSKRMAEHRRGINKTDRQHFKIYIAMKDIGVDKFYIELIENFPCDTKEQLTQREGHWIRHHDSFKNGYNGRVEGRNTQEWYAENREKLNEKKHEYNENNKERMNEKRRDWDANNKEKMTEYFKEYNANRKEQQAEYNKQYREANKEQLKQKAQAYYQNKKLSVSS